MIHDFQRLHPRVVSIQAKLDLVGTGIFLTPTKVVQYTHSVGITLLFWLGGAIAAMAGILVYMEFGLTTPRYDFIGQGKISVPRNGGELHYVSTRDQQNLLEEKRPD